MSDDVSHQAAEVAPGVLVTTSAIMATNSTVLFGEGQALLIDPAWLPSELDALAASLRAAQLQVIGGFATHAHHDHLLWHEGFGDGPRWASAVTAQLCTTEREALLTNLGAQFPRDLADLMGRVTAVEHSIPAASIPRGHEIELIIHNGHAPGHTALWLPRTRTLIAGDMLSDTELPLPFGPDDVDSYLHALEVLQPYAEQAELVIPGHGHLGNDAVARVHADRSYLTDVATTGDSADPRQHNEDMGEAHARIRELLAR